MGLQEQEAVTGPLWARRHVEAVLCASLRLVQSGLYTEVCPRFHGVVFVILPKKKTDF